MIITLVVVNILLICVLTGVFIIDLPFAARLTVTFS
jgi:hypothetical protein